MGSLLTFFRASVRPTQVIVLMTLLGAVGMLAMVYPSSITFADPMLIAVASASFAEGGMLVALCSFVHEEYGTEEFGILFGTMFSFGAAGLFAFDEVFFPGIFEWYAVELKSGSTVKTF